AQLHRDEELRLTTITAIIDDGRRAGEIDATKDARTLAWFVIATISGMRVLSRSGADRAALEAIATTALVTV
ncbi:MAG: TetR family transcriptional regulator, partial [Actinomycetes bacterium]